MKLWILCLLAVVCAYGQASWPESRLHDRLSFSGTPLPDDWSGWSAGPRVGLYIGKGTWKTGKEHLKMFFQEHGVGYRSLTAEQILAGELESSHLGMLVVPGGQSWEYLSELGDKGADIIRTFVANGGGYLGICAGAFYATSQRQGGPKTGPYGIGLLRGIAYDGTSLFTPPFKEGMLDFDTTSDPMMSGFRSTYRIVLLGGPSFRYDAVEARKKNVRVLARFQGIRDPAMILLTYGEGRVFLSAPHLEVEEDRTDWGSEYKDPDSEWPILERVTHYLLKDR